MYKVIIGRDLSDYSLISIPLDTSMTEERLAEIVTKVLESGEWMGKKVPFEAAFDTTCAARILSVEDEDGDTIFENVNLEPSPYNAGQVLKLWLNGRGKSLDDVIKEAVKSKLIDEPVMEVYRGIFKPDGAEAIDVEFECRKGATRAEKDMAFLDALTKKGAVNYREAF